MFMSGFAKPSRTTIFDCLPSLRISRCSAIPLPRASPSGLRCDVMRKLWPARMRSATSRAATSGFWLVVVVVVVILSFRFRCVFDEQRLDAAGPHRRLVVLEVELGCVAQVDPLAEESADAALCVLQFLDLLLRLFLLEAADEDARKVQIGADVDVCDRHEAERSGLQIMTQDLDERVADHRSHFRSASCFFHVSVAI